LIEAMARLQEGQQKSLRRPRQLVEHESEPPKKNSPKIVTINNSLQSKN